MQRWSETRTQTTGELIQGTRPAVLLRSGLLWLSCAATVLGSIGCGNDEIADPTNARAVAAVTRAGTLLTIALRPQTAALPETAETSDNSEDVLVDGSRAKFAVRGEFDNPNGSGKLGLGGNGRRSSEQLTMQLEVSFSGFEEAGLLLDSADGPLAILIDEQLEGETTVRSTIVYDGALLLTKLDEKGEVSLELSNLSVSVASDGSFNTCGRVGDEIVTLGECSPTIQ